MAGCGRIVCRESVVWLTLYTLRMIVMRIMSSFNSL